MAFGKPFTFSYNRRKILLYCRDTNFQLPSFQLFRFRVFRRCRKCVRSFSFSPYQDLLFPTDKKYIVKRDITQVRIYESVLIFEVDNIALKSDNYAMISSVKIALTDILKSKNKSMYALAKEENISYSTIHKMATKDIQSIDLEILEKICRNLQCTPNELFPKLSKNN